MKLNNPVYYFVLFMYCSVVELFGQTEQFTSLSAADPATMKSRVTADLESYIFIQDARFYAARAGYYYGLRNEQHLLGLSIPFVHSIFNADYAGFENTTGIGDIRMLYMFAMYPKNAGMLNRASFYLEATAPTGEYRLGRGAGTWLYKPGIVFTYRPDPNIAFYPEVRFQFSGANANISGGSSGIPDVEDNEKDNKLQDLVVQLPAILELPEWNGWFGIQAQYLQSFSEKEYFIFLRTDIGKMIGDNTAASLHLSKFIAGQPRLNVIVQVRFQFFLNPL